MPVILTVVLAALIFFYAGRVLYKFFKRVKEKDGHACHGCGKCAYKNKDNP